MTSARLVLCALVLAVAAALPSCSGGSPAGGDAYFNDFTSGLGPEWNVCCPSGDFAAANTSLANGILDLKVDKVSGAWKGALVILKTPFTYGEVQIRARVDAGTGSRVADLLWPASGQWPPEIDFHEIASGDRQLVLNTLHYPPGNQMIHTLYAADATAWHVFGVRWSPGLIEYTLDGKVEATVRSTHVPDEPMTLHLQVAVAENQTPDHVVHLQVDWVSLVPRDASPNPTPSPTVEPSPTA